jgi:hypothetical protein
LKSSLRRHFATWLLAAESIALTLNPALAASDPPSCPRKVLENTLVKLEGKLGSKSTANDNDGLIVESLTRQEYTEAYDPNRKVRPGPEAIPVTSGYKPPEILSQFGPEDPVLITTSDGREIEGTILKYEGLALSEGSNDSKGLRVATSVNFEGVDAQLYHIPTSSITSCISIDRASALARENIKPGASLVFQAGTQIHSGIYLGFRSKNEIYFSADAESEIVRVISLDRITGPITMTFHKKLASFDKGAFKIVANADRNLTNYHNRLTDLIDEYRKLGKSDQKSEEYFKSAKEELERFLRQLDLRKGELESYLTLALDKTHDAQFEAGASDTIDAMLHQLKDLEYVAQADLNTFKEAQGDIRLAKSKTRLALKKLSSDKQFRYELVFAGSTVGVVYLYDWYLKKKRAAHSH